MAKYPVTYEFECKNLSEYKLILILKGIENRMMKYIFQQSKIKLKHKGIDFNGNMDVIDSFKVDDQYLKLLKTALIKNFKVAYDEVYDDGIEIKNYDVKEAYYKRNESDNWDIYVTWEGTYIDKR